MSSKPTDRVVRRATGNYQQGRSEDIWSGTLPRKKIATSENERAYLGQIGGHIARHRTSRGYSTEDIAVVVGTTRRTMYRIENGETEPGILLLSRIATFYGIPLGELIGDYSSTHELVGSEAFKMLFRAWAHASDTQRFTILRTAQSLNPPA